ncbi:hypothetical protein [Haloplasma contractile]|uniref:Uncharacterized protein n=1 Tax=Haloplasma contractile SSD-17B TaxID=1033810 RepID=U2FNM6_9MOLU|nr:hypothetical protein [Haloplasma contractile]ERJ12724.1 hypothetical protein HLPCO_001064 [Haloplasma contractile SSD-17B]
MIKIEKLTNELKEKILNLLYTDEVYQVFLIHLIENNQQDILYINDYTHLETILHLKYDGNSYFTNFFTNDDKSLLSISNQLRSLNYKNILLAGKYEEVKTIMNFMNKNKAISLNKYYVYKNNNLKIQVNNSELKRATLDDFDIISLFLIDFF